MKNYYLPVSIVISGCLISVSILYKFNLDLLQKIFSIVGSFSIGIALIAYCYKKQQDWTIAAIEQVSFFREKIILEWETVAHKLKSKNKKYIFSRIRFDEPTIEFMREKYQINFQDQTAIFFENLDAPKIDSEILDLQIKLFNMLEEFSLKVLHFKTKEHQALNSVQHPFVEIIEKNAVALIFVRDIMVANPIYSATLLLYDSWKQKVGKFNYLIFLKNLEKNGLITKKQREEREKVIKSKRE